MANTRVFLAILCLGATLAATVALGWVNKNVYSQEFQPDSLVRQFGALEDWLSDHLDERKGSDLSYISKEIRKNLKKTTHDIQAYRAAELLLDSVKGITSSRCAHSDFENLRHLYYGIFDRSFRAEGAGSAYDNDFDDDERPFKTILEKALGEPLRKFVFDCSPQTYDVSLKKGVEMEMGSEEQAAVDKAVNRFKVVFQKDILRVYKSKMSYEQCDICTPLADEESIKHLAEVVQRNLPSSEINDQTLGEAYNKSIYNDCQLIVDAYPNVFDIHSKVARLARQPNELTFVEKKTFDYNSHLFQFHYCHSIIDQRSEIIGKIQGMLA